MIFSISIVLTPGLSIGDPHLVESPLSFHVM